LIEALVTGFEFDVLPLNPDDSTPIHVKVTDIVGYE
jgi:hypothetical protein